MLRLSVNIDHVATLRQARMGRDPEPVAAALIAQSAGAHGITVHLRGDRRHIQERDARLLKEVLSIPLNVESASTVEALETLIPLKPMWVTLVPETRDELTTQGGLDVMFLHSHLRQAIRELRRYDIHVSLFVDADKDQIKKAKDVGADAVEFNTGIYADLPEGADPSQELDRIRECARLASRLDMRVLAGHALNTRNLAPIAMIPEIEELNIGHSIVGRSVLVGFEQAVREMLQAISEARQ